MFHNPNELLHCTHPHGQVHQRLHRPQVRQLRHHLQVGGEGRGVAGQRERLFAGALQGDSVVRTKTVCRPAECTRPIQPRRTCPLALAPPTRLSQVHSQRHPQHERHSLAGQSLAVGCVVEQGGWGGGRRSIELSAMKQQGGSSSLHVAHSDITGCLDRTPTAAAASARCSLETFWQPSNMG